MLEKLLLIVFAVVPCLSNAEMTLRAPQLLAIPVEAGAVYEISVHAKLTLRDQTNGYAVAACYFSFDDGGVNVPADDTLVASALKRDDYRVLEFLFPDTATTNEVGIYRWTFQVRVPPPASVMRVDCKPWNRVSKALFGPLKVTKVSGPWISRPAGRNIRRNFRLVDGTDSLTVEGVAKSLHAGRVRIDVDSWQADGEESHTQTCVVDSNGVFRTEISFPPRTYGGCWSLGDVDAESVGETTFEPLWGYPSYRDKELQNVDKDSLDEQVDVEGCDAVDVVVQTYSDDSTMADNNCAVIVRAQLLDEHGEEMPLTSLPLSSKWGRYWYCCAGYGAHLTRRKVDIPSGARTLKLSISKFWEQANVILTDYRAIKTFAETPKLTYDADAQLKMSVVDWLGGENAVDQILTGSVPSLFVSLCESIEGCGCASAPDEKTIVFTSFNTPYQLKASIDWSENPFGNLTWQMNYSTGYWIPFTGLKADDYYAHVKRYWTSFFACNPWPRKANNMVYVDHASAARVEALLLTMFGNEPNERCAAKIPCLLDKLRGDPEFFYQILNQLRIDVELIHHHLKSKIYRIHNHNLIMAQVLLEFSQCFPKCGFSRRYAELSRYKIQEHLNLMFEPDGFIREQSTKYHHWMTLHFAEIYRYYRECRIEDSRALDAFRLKLARLFAVDLQLAMPDGIAAPMGDGAPPPVVKDDLTILEGLPDVDAAVKDEIARMKNRLMYLPESGLIVVRNPAEGKYLLIDLSDQVQEHGHKDFGSWQYFSQGIRWVLDVGGPYKYGTSICRSFAQSIPHSVVAPIGRSQSSGSALSVNISEVDGCYVVEAHDTVYGPRYNHAKRFKVAKDLSFFEVTDKFDSKNGGCVQCEGLIPTDADVTCIKEEEGWVLSREGRQLKLSLKASGSVLHEVDSCNSSMKMNELKKTSALRYRFAGVKGAGYSTVRVSDKRGLCTGD